MKKLLLYLAPLFFIMLTTASIHAQNLLTEDFESGTFPPTGWADSIYNNSGIFGGYPRWDSLASNVTNFVDNGNFYYVYPSPVAAHSGNYMAWFNSSDLYPGQDNAELATSAINIPTTPGGLTYVSFWLYSYEYVSGSFTSTGNDELDVYVNTQPNSTLGSPSLVASVFPHQGISVGWHKYTFQLPTNTLGNNYIIFKGISELGYDLFLDDVSVDYAPPCNGTPTGNVPDISVCSGYNFTLYYTDSLHGGLQYQWQYSTDTTNWITMVGDTSATVTTAVTTPTLFRAIVTCTNTNTTDTAVGHVALNPFYMCYCNDSNTVSNGGNLPTCNIGNVGIHTVPGNTTILNNGNAYPLTNNTTIVDNYTDYTSLSPTPMLYIDSSYRFSMVEILSDTGFVSSPAAIYIDFNHNGLFDANEAILNQTTISNSLPEVADTVTIPATAQLGMTGMRVILDPNGLNPPDPCTPPADGEVEDYFVNIQYGPCTGYPGAGTAYISDTLMCPNDGYTFMLTDTTHDHLASGLSWSWQMSPDNGVTWSTVTGSSNRDTMTLVYNNAATYRMRIICSNSGDTVFSNQVHINDNPSYGCYCVSMAIGGPGHDTTDVGAFSIANYIFDPQSGMNQSHLNNPSAIRGRTDYTADIMDLKEDTTYPVMIYQVLSSATHADGKVTIFIDFNNDLTYDASERVFMATTSNTNFYLTGNVTIPNNITTEVPTGMRVIINNNVNPNVPSDDGCGVYTSGETEDYAVRFHDWATEVGGNIQTLKDLLVYPNPSQGTFRVEFNSTKTIKNLQISVTNITGQQVLERTYENTSGAFSTMLDLTKQSPGIYFIELQADGARMVRKLTIE